jgi:hypothetical protein
MDYTPEELRFLTLIGQVTDKGAASAAPKSNTPPPTDPTKDEAK